MPESIMITIEPVINPVNWISQDFTKADNLSFVPTKFSRNKLSHTIDPADITISDRSTLKYYLELQVPEHQFYGDFVKLHRSEGREKPVTVDSTNTSTFYGAVFNYNQRSGKLDSSLKFVKPLFGQKKLSYVVEQTMQYKIREIVTGGTPVVNTDTISSPQWIIKAGLSIADYMAYQDTFFSVQQNQDRRFLTWQPNGVMVSKTSEHYLSYFMNFLPMPISVVLRCRYFTNQYEEFVTVDTISNIPFGSILIAPVGFSAMNLPADTVYYEVWLTNEHNEMISEKRKYYVETIFRTTQKAIVFQNALGGWDTFVMKGSSSESIKVSRVSAKQDLSEDSIENGLLNISIEGTQEIQVSTGWIEQSAKERLKHLDELLLSELIFLQTTKGHQALELVSSELVDSKDNEQLISRTFVFKIVDVNNYSSALPKQPSPSRPIGWKGLDYSHLLDVFGKRTGYMKPQRLQKIYSDNNAVFKPLTFKANVPNTEGYIEKIFNPDVVIGSTPYPNTLISREGSYIRTACTVGTPGRATITVAAAKYGGEKPGYAQELAEIEFRQIDTQAYADSNGVCYPDPWSYAYTVPVNYAHFRFAPIRTPSAYADNSVVKGVKGNSWWVNLDYAGQPDVYPTGTNDINLPTTFATTEGWRNWYL